MKQILDCLGNEVAQKRAGVHPNQEDDNPDWTEDESAVASAPWIQAKSKGSKSSPTQLKKAQQPHRQSQRSQQDVQRQQQLQLQQQRAELRKQAEEKEQKEREEAQEKAREEERRKEREEAEEQERKNKEAHEQYWANVRARVEERQPQQPPHADMRDVRSEFSKRQSEAHLQAQELWSEERDKLLLTQQQLQQQVDRQQQQLSQQQQQQQQFQQQARQQQIQPQ